MELFGPTIQGEGPQAGQPCYFVRLGGCDFRCSWCDSMHAVDPEQVREHARQLEPIAILQELEQLDGDPDVVVLSGGNPALHDCGELVGLLSEAGYLVAVETQGTRWKPWLEHVDMLVVSPKPPSSGMVTPGNDQIAASFMQRAMLFYEKGGEVALKIVVFDAEDLEWAQAYLAGRPSGLPTFLSVGTPVDAPSEGEAVDQVLMRYRWLCDEVKIRPALSQVRVLPQMHVLAWGLARAV